MKKEINFIPREELLYKINKNTGGLFRKGNFIVYSGYSEEEEIALRRPYYEQVNSYGQSISGQTLDKLHVILLLRLNIISKYENCEMCGKLLIDEKSFNPYYLINLCKSCYLKTKEGSDYTFSNQGLWKNYLLLKSLDKVLKKNKYKL